MARGSKVFSNLARVFTFLQFLIFSVFLHVFASDPTASKRVNNWPMASSRR
jgi:hypothetical protein